MKKVFKLFCSTVVAASVLYACGSAETENEETELETTLDRSFVYVAQQVVGSVDPAKIIDETEVIAAINLYDPLVYPKVEENSMDPGSHIADSWDISEDGLTYIFNLREDVVFHSGNPLTADDVIYSMERMQAINEGNAWLWDGVLEEGSITKLDEHTIEITLNTPYAPFLSSMTQFFVVDSQELIDNQEEGDFGEFGDYGQSFLENNVAGSGPYTLTNWDRESQLDFTAFEDYWKGWNEGQLEEAQMRIITEEATVKTLLASGQADMVHQWLTSSAYEEFTSNESIIVQTDTGSQLQHMPMNNQKAPTDDVNVRRAIAQVFDYQSVLDSIVPDSSQAQGPVPNGVSGHSDNVTVFQQDVALAQEYLEQSQYSDEELTVSFMYLSDNPEHRQYAQLLQSNLSEIGITVELQPVTWPQITEAATSPESTPNLALISDSLKYPHVDSHTYGIYHPSTHGSYRSMSWYDNTEVTELLETARETIDLDEQLDVYEEVQDLVTADAPSIYIVNPDHNIAFQDYVKGYTYVGIMGYDISFYHFTIE